MTPTIRKKVPIPSQLRRGTKWWHPLLAEMGVGDMVEVPSIAEANQLLQAFFRQRPGKMRGSYRRNPEGTFNVWRTK